MKSNAVLKKKVIKSKLDLLSYTWDVFRVTNLYFSITVLMIIIIYIVINIIYYLYYDKLFMSEKAQHWS